MKQKIYDSSDSNEFALADLIELYRKTGVCKILYKRLAPNDNSKNQPYMAGHITDLGFIPTGEIVESKSSSKKTSDPKRSVKFAADLNYFWLSHDGHSYHAPNAKLIYYPQYPEVRLSGFLKGCEIDSGGWMDPMKKGRTTGRTLFFGIKEDGEGGSVYAYLATPESRIAKEIDSVDSAELTSIFREIPLTIETLVDGDSRATLIQELKRIHQKGLIEGKKLNKHGVEKAYSAANGGGYTLEAELGVIPNGLAEPDFLGWEIKQFGVGSFERINSKVLTIMTPEPDGGVYVDEGVESFVRNYGYADTKGRTGRFNFNGRHIANCRSSKTNLTLVVYGYDSEGDRLVDAAGFIGLEDEHGVIVAKWSFSKIINHWKRKHARAAYIPSVYRTSEGGGRAYQYGNKVRLFEGTNILKLLKAISCGAVYYDPGIKLENADTSPTTKRRSQFRVKSSALDTLYDRLDCIDVMTD